MTEFDPRTPAIARVYDCLLGGKDNFAADRAVAERLVALYPPIIETVPESRRFIARAISWVAGLGITQFIDLGAGLPTEPSTHVTAQAAWPMATVAYIDNDPVVITHLRALACGDRVAVVAGDLADRDATLGAASLRTVIDLGRPVCLVMGMILHFYPAAMAAELVRSYLAAVPPGSFLVATIASGKGALAGRFYDAYNAGGFATMHNHTSADFASFFAGLDIMPPGLGDARRIHPGRPGFTAVPKRPDRILACVARTTPAS